MCSTFSLVYSAEGYKLRLQRACLPALLNDPYRKFSLRWHLFAVTSCFVKRVVWFWCRGGWHVLQCAVHGTPVEVRKYRAGVSPFFQFRWSALSASTFVLEPSHLATCLSLPFLEFYKTKLPSCLCLFYPYSFIVISLTVIH